MIFFLSTLGNGKNDMMVSFCCNKGVMNWDNGGDPWLEHLLCTPTCTFVKLNKGISYIHEVYTSYLSNNTLHVSIKLLVLLRYKHNFHCFTAGDKI